MSIIIKLQGLPFEAGSVDVRRYFLGLTIPDGGVHIVGGDDGTVFIEFASDEDARQAMARGDGTIKNSKIRLLLSSRSEMQSVTEVARQWQHQYRQQQLQSQVQQTNLLQQQNFNQTQQPFLSTDLAYLSTGVAPACLMVGPALLPTTQPQQTAPFEGDPRMLSQNYQRMMNVVDQQPQSPKNQQQQQQLQNNRARMSGMRGGDDKLFANKRCVLAASNIPYRATSKDIIEFLSEFNIKEDCIRRRYNQKGQPTADAKIAFPNPDAAMKAFKMMNKKTLCGRPVFLKPV